MTSIRSPRLAPESWRARAERSGRTAWSGAFFGIGAMAFVDEVVFHQVLQWHSFYDLGTTELGILSDGIFHAVSWFATIAGLFLLADLRRHGALWWRRWVGGALAGAGAFQLYDGVVHHKLLGIHEIRYVENLLPYDVTWNVTAALLLATGVLLLALTRRSVAVARSDADASR